MIVTNSTNRPLKVVLPPGLVASGATGPMMGLGGGMGGGAWAAAWVVHGRRHGRYGRRHGRHGRRHRRHGWSRRHDGRRRRDDARVDGHDDPRPTDHVPRRRDVLLERFSSIAADGRHGRRHGHGRRYGRRHGRHGYGWRDDGRHGRRDAAPCPRLVSRSAVVNPGQTLRLPTRLVSLGSPSAEGDAVAMPAQGEKLTLGDVTGPAGNLRPTDGPGRPPGWPRPRPPTIASQLVLWSVSAGLDWGTPSPGLLSAAWADPPRRGALARRFVASLGPFADGAEEQGTIFVRAEGDADLASAFAKLAGDGSLARPGRSRPAPARAPRRAVAGRDDRRQRPPRTRPRSPRGSSNGKGQWVDVAKLTLPRRQEGRENRRPGVLRRGPGRRPPGPRRRGVRLVKAKKAHA